MRGICGGERVEDERDLSRLLPHADVSRALRIASLFALVRKFACRRRAYAALARERRWVAKYREGTEFI